MGLENPTYLNDLVETNPVGLLDFRNEGDDHLRGIKGALKRTFPGFNGRIWRRRNVTASGPLSITDNCSLIRATQALTLTPNAASVLGEWMCYIRAEGGTVAVNPGETINGSASMNIPNGYMGILFCDGTQFYMSIVYQDVPPSVKAFPTGTKTSFNQTAAPTGWTKLTSAVYDNAAIRLTTGTSGTGGTDGFSSTFSSGRSTSGHTLTVSQMPPHTHTIPIAGTDGGGEPQAGQPNLGSISSGSAGGGGSHSHGIQNMNIKYVDFIVASID